jgi:hypothetical protein
MYPFTWHHIFLPLLPAAFLDYLSAPTPFLIGLPGPLRHALASQDLDAVVVIDLDSGVIDPAPGTVADDGARLPGRDQLVAAFAELKQRATSRCDYSLNEPMGAVFQVRTVP